MGLFDKVLETGVKGFDKAKDLGSKGFDKAKDLGEKGKAKVQIAQTEMEIKKIYEEIAADLFTAHPEFIQGAYPDKWAKFTELRNKIEELKADKQEAEQKEETSEA